MTLTIGITGINLPDDLSYEGFNGKPEDQKVLCQKGSAQKGNIVMPPYSFRVFEW